jgi:polar amino acid transport system substrate-binding protein
MADAAKEISMRRAWSWEISLCLLFCLSFFSLSAMAEEKTLTIAADVWCPINCDPTGTEQGIGIDLAREIFAPLGYKVAYVTMPWARALQEAREGKVDAVVGANHSDDPSLIFPKTPLSATNDNLYARKDDHFPFTDISSLREKRIGIIRDYGYGERVKALIAQQASLPGGLQIVSGDDALEQNIKKLLAGRIDIAVESGIIMSYKLKKMGLTDKIRQVGGWAEDYTYIAFSPALASSENRAWQFDIGMARLRASGEINGLYAVYGLKP